MEAVHGLLVVDKPGGMTSRDVVNRFQGQFPRKTKIGHAGTLDPLATGVLVVAVGHATRLIEYVQEQGKTYRATIRFGATSDTDDADGEVVPVAGARMPERGEVEAALPAFVGLIEQLPPKYSALKIGGRRAHDLARRELPVELSPRPVRIDSINLLEFTGETVNLRIACGKGTYIRSIARDLGERLGCGGYLTALRRERIGAFTLENAIGHDALRPSLLPMAKAVEHLPRVIVDADAVALLFQGGFVPVSISDVVEVAVFDGSDGLVAIGKVEEGLLKPCKVFK